MSAELIHCIKKGIMRDIVISHRDTSIYMYRICIVYTVKLLYLSNFMVVGLLLDYFGVYKYKQLYFNLEQRAVYNTSCLLSETLWSWSASFSIGS